MGRELWLIKSSDFSEKIFATYSQAEICKKFSQGDIEVNTYLFPKGSSLSVDGTLSQEGIKTYILQKGSCYNVETQRILRAGDMFVVDCNPDILNFEMLEETLIFVHSINNQTFSGFVSMAGNITKLLDEIQTKDSYTGEHCIRVVALARKIAIRCRLSSRELHHMTMAARYHDIGKIYIENDVLNKPGFLTASEYTHMQSHVLNGKDIICEHFNQEIFDIIALHHERLDGSGYPKGLKGEEISLEGRILAVCDSYDAMVTDRVYKKGKSVPEALAELRSMAGQFYDPDVVELLAEVLGE